MPACGDIAIYYIRVKLEHSLPKRILIVRISALGDIVFCTSLLAGLRKTYPSAHIAWLVDPVLGGILEGDPRLNEIIRLPAGATKSLSGLRAARRLLRRERRYDWVIDAQGLLKSRFLARCVPADRYIGFDSKEPAAFLMNRLHAKGGPPGQISSEYRYLSEQITASDPGPPQLFPVALARERAKVILQMAHLPSGFIALCPFTTRPQKHWMEPYWAQLAHLISDMGLGPCAILGGPQDLEAGKRIHADMPAGTINLVGATPLPDLPAVMDCAQLVIGVDTGLTHIGIALGRPVLALFGSTRPYTEGAQSPLRVLYQDMSCAPCKRKPSCNGAFSCMRDLSPKMVAGAAAQLLSTGAPPR